jgi:hypothetical protein
VPTALSREQIEAFANCGVTFAFIQIGWRGGGISEIGATQMLRAG